MSDSLLGHENLSQDVPAEVISVKRDSQGQIISVTEYYADDVVKTSYDMQDGLKHGEYVSFYPNGEVDMYGYFIAGKKHGRATKNFPDGRLWTEQNFRYGKLNGRSCYYDIATGNLVLRMYFREDMLHGLCESFHADGKPKHSVMYQNGVVNTALSPVPYEVPSAAMRARTSMVYRLNKPIDLLSFWRRS